MSGWRGALLPALAALVGVAAGVVVTLAVLGSDAAPPPAALGPRSTTDVVDVARTVVPSVVRIDVRGVGAGTSGNASGVVWDDEGHVVTNDHVVGAATTITVVLADGRSLPASLVGTDPLTDLAVVRVMADLPPGLALAEDPPQVGQVAIAVAAPQGLDGSVSVGVLSAVDREVDLRGRDGGLIRLQGVLQTDAGIDPGSSGGALVDDRGQLLGVISANIGPDVGSGIGFAVPAATVEEVIDALIMGGRIPTPVLGLTGATADAAVPGVVVRSTVEGGPAQTAGLTAGDVVVAVDGRDIRSMSDLVAEVRSAGPGGRIGVTFVRDEAEQTASVTLGEESDR